MKMPKHWRSLFLKDVIIAKKGKKPLKLSTDSFPNSIPYLDIDAIQNGNIKQFADRYSTVIAKDTDIFIVADGSRSGLVSRGMEGAVGSTILAITPIGIASDYLFYFLQFNYEYLNLNTTGSSIPHLNIDLFLNLIVPIPPIPEQLKIVSELREKLFQYEKEFKYAEEEFSKIESYKQSVIDQAIKGKLTESWRENNHVSIEKTRNELFSLQASAAVLDDSLIDNIPSSWILTDALSICKKITDGEHQTPQRISKGKMLLTAKNVRDGFLDFDNVEYISDADYIKLRKRCNPEKNDVLIVSVGATIGRTAVLLEDKPFVLVRSVALLKPKISGEFLMYCLQSSFLQDIIKSSSQGVAQATLYINKINQLPIPFTTLDEQIEIVKTIKYHLTSAKKIEKETVDTLKRLNDLKLALFQMAFGGLLCKPHFIEDNWYEELLSSIKLEKLLAQENTARERTVKRKHLINLKTSMVSRDIIEILNSLPNKKLGVDQVWQQSKHYEKSDIEGFYEELETLLNRDDKDAGVVWEFSDKENKQVFLKIR